MKYFIHVEGHLLGHSAGTEPKAITGPEIMPAVEEFVKLMDAYATEIARGELKVVMEYRSE